MKTIFSLMTITLWMLFANIAKAFPSTVYLDLSPFYEPQDRTNTCNIIAQLLTTAPLGTRFVAIDGWNRQTIAEMTLPHDLLMPNSIAARKKAVRVGLVKLMQWFNRSASTPAPPVLAGSAMVDLPGSLELICAQPAATHEAILVIASPLYHSLTEPQFSFVQPVAGFPSDAHLFGDPNATVFSIVDKRHRLHNRAVFMWFPRESLFATDVYRERVERFWSLYVSFQDGTLARFGADANAVLDGLFQESPSPVHQYSLDPRFNRIEMLSIVRPIPPRRTITNELGQVTFVVEQDSTASHKADEQNSEQAIIDDLHNLPESKTAAGIMWATPSVDPNNGVDLDIYVWQSEKTQPLYYRNTRTPEGYFVHDYRGHNEELDYEKVILDVPPVSLDSMRIAVNFYGGRAAQPVTGKLFVRFHGVTYEGSFSLAVREGNQGADLLNHAGSPFWTDVNVGKLQPVTEDRPTASR